jgi:D-alanyl-D-alanine carboxypeptidase
VLRVDLDEAPPSSSVRRVPREATSRLGTNKTRGVVARRRAVARRRRLAAGVLVALVVGGGFLLLRGDDPAPVGPEDVRGSPAWALEHYGNPESRSFERVNVVEFDFLGRSVFVHKDARPHFMRLERLFEARAPEYAATVALGELDDWSYENRAVRGGVAKSNHAFGIAIDINALANPLGTTGDMPTEVVRQWEAEGGGWGGDWSRPDPMHFETHLTPEEIRQRYRSDGTPRPWYLEELVGG